MDAVQAGESAKAVKDADRIWEAAYESNTFKQISEKRFRFVIPGLIVFCSAFFLLWIMQGVFPQVAAIRIAGNINVNWTATMLIFPFVWILGYVYVKYINRVVYPLEEELIEKFGKGLKK